MRNRGKNRQTQRLPGGDMTEPNRGKTENSGKSGFGRKVLTATGIAGGLALLTLLVFYTVDIFLLLFSGILLAIFLHGMSAWLGRKVKVPPRWSLCASLLVIFGFIAAVIWLLAPDVSNQLDQLRAELPRAFRSARAYMEEIVPVEQLLQKIPPLEELIYGKAGAGLFRQIAGFFSNTFSVIANFVIFLFAGLYLALDPDTYIIGMIRLIPPRKRHRAREVVNAVGDALRWWLLGTLMDMAFVGVLIGLGLWMLGIQLALTLGILSALLTFIPYIGPALAAVPAVLLAFIQGPATMLYVVILYIAVQMIEGYLTAPLIQQRTVSLPPVLTLTVQIVFGSFFGFLGLMLATPLAAAGLVLVKKVYVEDVLGDRETAG